MDIKILGTGCARCHQLKKSVREVIKELGVDATLEEVKDITKIMEYPILATPGLVIDTGGVSTTPGGLTGSAARTARHRPENPLRAALGSGAAEAVSPTGAH